MADGHRTYPFPVYNARDPDFRRQWRVWTDEQITDIARLVTGTKAIIADSKALIAEIDRLLGA